MLYNAGSSGLNLEEELARFEEIDNEEEDCNISFSDDSIGSEKLDDEKKKIPVSLAFKRNKNSINLNLNELALRRKQEHAQISAEIMDKVYLTARSTISRQERITPIFLSHNPPIEVIPASSIKKKCGVLRKDRSSERSRGSATGRKSQLAAEKSLARVSCERRRNLIN